MNTEDELAMRRIDRADRLGTNKGVRPVDLLRTMIHDIETGEIECDGVLLCYLNRKDEDKWTMGAYRANLTLDAELVLLELQRERCIRNWLGSPMVTKV